MGRNIYVALLGQNLQNTALELQKAAKTQFGGRVEGDNKREREEGGRVEKSRREERVAVVEGDLLIFP